MNNQFIADALGVTEAVENRVYKSDPAAVSWFYDSRRADLPVATENLLRIGTVWAGVNIIAGDMGQIPIGVMRETPEGMQPAPNHPIARLMRDGPNYWQTPDQWIEWMVATAIIWGNSLSYIERDNMGRPVALHPIPPIYADWNVDHETGTPYYVVHAPDWTPQVLFIPDVVHLRTLSTTGFWGLRLAEVAYNELSLVQASKRHAANLFERGAFPAGVLEHPGKLGPEVRQQLRDEWHSIHGGGNSGRLAVLWEGMKYNPTAISPADAQLLEMVSHDATLVGQVLGISPYFLGDLRNNATRANLEEESKQYYARTLRRRVKSLVAELQRKLIIAPVYRVQADPTEFLKGDLETQVDVAGKAVQFRLWTRNEGRAYLGMNRVEGGDEFENPAIDTANASPEEEPPATDGENAAARRIRRVEAEKLARQAKQSRNFVAYVDKFYSGPFGQVADTEWPGASAALADYAEKRKTAVLDLTGQHASGAALAEAILSENPAADVAAIATALGG